MAKPIEKKQPIRTKLIFISITLLLNILLFVAIAYTSAVNIIQATAQGANRNFLSSENYLAGYMRSYKMIATNLSQRTSVQSYLLESGEMEIISQAEDIREIIRAMQVFRTEIISIGIIRNDGRALGTEPYIWRLVREGKIDQTGDGFSDLYRLPAGDTRQFYSLSVFDARGLAATESIGTIVISFNPQIYSNLLGAEEDMNGDLFFVIDREGNIAQTNAESGDGVLRYQPQWNTLLQREVCRYQGEIYLPFEKEVEATGWKMVYFCSLAKIVSQMFSSILPLIILSLLLEIVSFVFSVHIFSRVGISLSEVVNFADNILPSDYSSRLHFSRRDEFGVIGDGINRLLDASQKMDSQVMAAQQHLYEAELSRKNMEMNFLQSQINPHFLYNTLDCIRSIAEIRDVTEISELAMAMADIYRYSLKADPYVALEEEMRYVEEYFSALGIRFMGRFSLRIDCPPAVGRAQIFRMLLQPFVENSVLHGLERKCGRGVVVIRAERQEDILILTVEDNGCGMSAEQLAELRASLNADEDQPGKSIGLTNVYRRIKNAYGEQYGFEIASELQKGTQVRITVPFIPSDEE